jgi:hypothetical protein
MPGAAGACIEITMPGSMPGFVFFRPRDGES